MTNIKDPLPEDPKDGFDLIEYPCDYGFKAMCRVDSFGKSSAADTMRQLVLTHVNESSLLDIKTNQSRTGKFESVTLLVRLNGREELEAIYGAISASPIVVMTL